MHYRVNAYMDSHNELSSDALPSECLMDSHSDAYRVNAYMDSHNELSSDALPSECLHGLTQ